MSLLKIQLGALHSRVKKSTKQHFVIGSGGGNRGVLMEPTSCN